MNALCAESLRRIRTLAPHAVVAILAVITMLRRTANSGESRLRCTSLKLSYFIWTLMGV